MRLGKKKIATKMKIESRSKEETKTYQEWFNLVDSDGDGRISGNDTTKFFALSNLSRSQLKRLWALADVKRQGFLGFTEFVTAMQLVSLAQVGQELNSDILKTQSKFDKENIKPPVLEGLDALVAQMSLTINAPPEEHMLDQSLPLIDFLLSCLDLIKEAFLEILLLLMLTCLLVAWQHLEVHFYLSSNALKCHTLYIILWN
ncbi:EH domain-containing protein 2 isoform X3 [Glycine max]|uniref:EH domain-containing protein 2 isoform X3 n=1 Tax=Glycine max TaxID=3847 RepID=UPI0003DEA8AC|nr:EH domain-containing protein 2 isoform X3 [Glycine max]XP_040873730.1 EH domain-containing protein 2 isoform X3 [Glycine max]